MKTAVTAIIAAVLALLPSGFAYAQSTRPLSATDTGVNGAALAAGAAITDTIQMKAPGQLGGRMGWELALHGVATAGTSALCVISCEESHDLVTWAWVHHCTDAAASTCVKQTLSYDISTTATVSMVLRTRAPWVRCTFDDTADGSGTIVVTGTVSTLR